MSIYENPVSTLILHQSKRIRPLWRQWSLAWSRKCKQLYSCTTPASYYCICVSQTLWLLGSAPSHWSGSKGRWLESRSLSRQCHSVCHTLSLGSAHTAAAGRHGNTQTPRSLRQLPSQLNYSVPKKNPKRLNTNIPALKNWQNTEVVAAQPFRL